MSDPVFVLRLPLELAPTMNRYGSMAPWQRAKLYKKLDEAICAATYSFPNARAGFTSRAELAPKTKSGVRVVRVGGRRRRVVVTRYSSVEPDEPAVDVVGGKVPVDRLVRAGVLVGDTPTWLEREGRWERAPQNAGRLVVEVYEL